MRGRRSGETRARQAALIPATNLVRARLAGSAAGGHHWQEQVRRFDQDGPGVCGYYLDLVALLASLCPLTVEVRQNDGSWVASDDPVLNAIISHYRSPVASQAELVALHVRHRESMGEAWLVNSERIGYYVLTVPNVTVTSDAVMWTDIFGKRRTTPADRVWKSMVPDPYQPWMPTSPLRRAIPDLRRLRAATRNQTRAAESRLVMNGLVAFPDDSGNGSRPLATVDDTSELTGTDKLVDDYIELAKAAFNDDDSVAAAVPFPYVGPAAQYVELGRGIDQQALQVEDRAIEAFARAVNFPAQLLTSGPGAANHWNEWLLEESQRKMGLTPKLQPVCSDLTEFYLRPEVVRMQHRLGSWDSVSADRVRVGFDSSFLTSKPDRTAQILQAWSQGVASMAEVAEVLGITKTLAIPGGMSEYEHWQLATSKPGAPYADVDEEGNLVAAPDVFGGGAEGGDMAAAMEALGGAGAEPPAPEEPPAAPEPAPTDLGAVNQAPPPPPAQLAAMDDQQRVAERVLDRLYGADRALEAALSASAQACVDRVTDYTAREIIKAHPQRSPLRAELRDLPAEQVWVNADPTVRATFDLERTVAEAAAECQTAHEDAFGAAAGVAAGALLLAGLNSDSDDIDGTLGALILTGLIARHVTKRFHKGTGSPNFSAGGVRSAMAAAGGALVDAAGSLIRGGDNMPTTADSSPWAGNVGAATGHKTMRKVLEWLREAQKPGGPALDIRVQWEWVHSFFGIPGTPFPPHVALDGARFDSPDDLPGNLFPGDHNGCRCAIRPIITITRGTV